jgi:hypothetical protein
MIFKLLFVRRSGGSFKVYVLARGKIRSSILSAQLESLKFGSRSVSDIFVRASLDRKSMRYFRDIKFFNNCIAEFIEFVQHARDRKILCF